MKPPKFRSRATGQAHAARLARIFHTTHEMPTDCSRRREEADHLQRPIHPPPHVGGYEGCVKSGLAACFRGAITLLTTFGFLITASPVRAAGTVTDCAFASLVITLQGGGLVTLPCNSTIVFANTITITNDTIIDATGYAPVLSGNNAVRLFEVRSNVNLTLINVTLTGGNVAGTNGANGANHSGSNPNGHNATGGGDAFAGAIYNLGTLRLTGCSIKSNNVVAGNGGGGGNGGIQGFGGGDGGDGGNAGKAFGGAIYNAGAAFLTNCTVAANTVTGGNGGSGGSSGGAPGRNGAGGAGGVGNGAGIFNRGTLTINGSTFSDNSASGGNSMKAGTGGSGASGSNGDPGGSGLGGGIYSTGVLAVVNCTFASNKTGGGNGGDGGAGDWEGGNGGNGGLASGGGIYSLATAAITNCTLSGNSVTGGTNGLGDSSAPNGAPGLSSGGNIARGGGSFALANSIIANAGSGGNGYGTFTDAGCNVSSDNSVTLTNIGSVKNTNANLSALGNFGGPTQTILPLTGSPAIDRGSLSGCLAIDQRGTNRYSGNNCDAGAVETAGLVIQTPPQGQTVAGGANVTFNVTAIGESPINYQWRFNNTNLASATNLTLTLANVQPTNAGNYLVVVANPSGTRTSAVAVLKVLVPFSMTAPMLSNESNFFFTFNTATGFTYYVEYKDSLSDSNWIRLRTNVGNGNFFTNLVPVGGTTSRFFRASVQ